MNSPHKGQWRGALVCSLICAWINGWVSNREAGDFRTKDGLYSQTSELIYTSLQWRHNGRDGVSNHQRLDCFLSRLFRRRSKKHQSSASLAFVRGIHRWPVNSPHKGPVTRNMFPFDDVIMWSDHSRDCTGQTVLHLMVTANRKCHHCCVCSSEDYFKTI